MEECKGVMPHKCGRLNNGPSRSLEPVNVTLRGGRECADEIKDLERGDHPELSGWALFVLTGILVLERRRFDTGRGGL